MRPFPRLLIAGTGSGVGKTVVTTGVIGALRRRGLTVQPFKCGPDYIDPGYHARAAGRACRNLDPWMLGEPALGDSLARAAMAADISIIEGQMGLFDGVGFDTTDGSAARIAAALGAPVVLVVDISGSARSAAAAALGFVRFDPALPVAAVLLNRAGSERHAHGCAAAITEVTGVPVLGWLPRRSDLSVRERHLGLHTVEGDEVDAVLERAADAVESHCDLDGLLRLARAAPPLPATSRPTAPAPYAAKGAPLLAVARDAAFAFYYPDNLDLLAAAGLRIAFFSPPAGDPLPPGTSGVYLGGGYPELHAAALSRNGAFWAGLRALHAQGAPILAECGGFMVLTEALVDATGQRHPMAGLVPGVARMTTQLAALGYREATALRDTLLADAGETLRAHEFHYSVWDHDPQGCAPAWAVRGSRPGSPTGLAGHAERGLLASYLHIHLGQRLALAHRLAARLAEAEPWAA